MTSTTFASAFAFSVVVLATASNADAGSLCTEFGYSGRPRNTLSCVETRTERTITCIDGFAANHPDSASIALTGNAPFMGCHPIDRCATVGYSGRTANTQACKMLPNARMITCVAGYYPVVAEGRAATDVELQQTTITLTGTTPFLGCRAALVKAAPMNVKVDRIKVLSTSTDKCTNPGYSGKTDNALGCKPIDGGRIVTCASGYFALPTGRNPTLVEMRSSSITLMGAAAFAGCKQQSMCLLHGYNGAPKNVLSCADGVNQRTITCVPGHFPVAANKADQANVKGAVLTLVGDAKFSGCVATPG